MRWRWGYIGKHRDDSPRPDCTCEVGEPNAPGHGPDCAVTLEKIKRLGLTGGRVHAV